jgi:hypothetical protein
MDYGKRKYKAQRTDASSNQMLGDSSLTPSVDISLPQHKHCDNAKGCNF